MSHADKRRHFSSPSRTFTCVLNQVCFLDHDYTVQSDHQGIYLLVLPLPVLIKPACYHEVFKFISADNCAELFLWGVL